MARDIINEINELKRRDSYNSGLDFQLHLQSLNDLIDNLSKFNNAQKSEILKYIPVSLVACLQAFFRTSIKNLIDFGSPFRQNVKEFNKVKNIKFDFDIVDAIHSKNLTIGDFVSHILSFNSFDDINSNVSTILDLNYLEELKKYKSKNEYVIEKFNKTYQDHYNEIILDLKSLFELRNIICHEFTSNAKVEENQVINYFKSTEVFLRQSNSFLFNIQYPNAPRTEAEMNEHVLNEFSEINDKFENIVSQILNREEKHEHQLDNQRFENYITKWKEYLEARAECDSYNSYGGNMENMIYSISMTRTTEEMIESLTNYFPYIFDENFKHF